MRNLALKKSLKVYVGIPWLRNDHFKPYLKSCISHIERQEISVEVLPPKPTNPFSGNFERGQRSRLYAIMDRMNAVIDDYMKTSASHLFMVDADVEIPPHALETLLRHDVDVASGVYPYHNFEDCHAMMGGRMDTKNPCGFFHPRDWSYMEGLVMGDEYPVSAGTGCMLVKRRVFNRYHQKIKPLRFTKKGGECGADVYFWKRVQDAGFTARLDANVVCGHLPDYALSRADEWLK